MGLPDGRLLLWVDPNACGPKEHDGAASPQVHEFAARDVTKPARRLVRVWNRRTRFHVLPDGRLLVLYYVSGKDAAGKALAENRLIEIRDDGTLGPAVRVPLQTPMASFFTATPRAGCAPAAVIDLFGDVGKALRYARLRVAPPPP